MILWGTVTCCMAGIKTYGHLVALRTILGCLEAGFAPGVLLLFSSWYKKEEQSKRFAVYISAAILSGAFGGLLAGGIISGLEGRYGIRGWKWLFVSNASPLPNFSGWLTNRRQIVEGAASIGWVGISWRFSSTQNLHDFFSFLEFVINRSDLLQAVISHFLLLDFPATSKRLSTAQRSLAVSRLKSEDKSFPLEAASDIKLTLTQAIKQALQNWRVWLFTLGYMVIVGSSALTYFYPTLVQGLGYKGTKAQYMTVPIYAAAFVCNAFTGYLCDFFPGKRSLVLSTWLLLALICSVCVCTIYNFTARYVLLLFLASSLWSSNALSLSLASSTLSDSSCETRAVSLAFINAMGNLAQIYGAYLFPSADGPKYIMGFAVISAMCAFGVGVYGILHLLLCRR